MGLLGTRHITFCSAASHVYLSISHSGWINWTRSLNRTLPTLTTFGLDLPMHTTSRRRPYEWAEGNKKNYDQYTKESFLEVGDHVLVRNLSTRGKHKLHVKLTILRQNMKSKKCKSSQDTIMYYLSSLILHF
jgi:hypothetical protein